MISPTDFWMNYRKKTGKLLWRLAKPEDMNAILHLRDVSRRFMRENQNNANLFTPPVILTLVAENEKGAVVDALYVECQAELVKLGCSASGFEECAGLEEDLSRWLRAVGFRNVYVTTAPKLKDTMGPTLMRLGLRCMDGAFSYWRRRL